MDETFTPVPRLGQRAGRVRAVGGEGVGDRRGRRVVVLVLVARYTTWGRQFWRITGGYFKGRESVPVWALLGVLLLLVMIDVRIVGAVQLSVQRPVLGAAGRLRRRRSRESVLQDRLLGGDLDTRRR